MVYFILGTSIAITVITLWVLNRHSGSTQMDSDVSIWYTRFLILGTVLSAVFGLIPLLFPVQPAQLLGFHGTDVFLIFFFNDTATTEIYTLSLHDALPI